ncbi:Amidohydrolase family protein [Candida parapsilosis]|uniref:Amidohydrolase family protein n=1 Tax=Candida parapsilosis TaxID=5480 RepID=A0A8X7NKI8_CANPA|nr:Amidohydrolase family protein [Candida parapsilosis]KAF6046698.1 Amidohydrolase family protein [Candida parapsilosis]KAF6046879.1 Amidohydrolase family protein [Candida parapsilosis]KAF6050861.1 Amidohydrolase family protein [Candida parapsilosis]KAF6062417.1 Amidohydrolase family protein [Candida parapsilosis]
MKNEWFKQLPNIKFILSHAGAFLPYAADRIALVESGVIGYDKVLSTLRNFYFDIALTGPHAMAPLFEFAHPERIRFGSDWSYAFCAISKWSTTNLESNKIVDGAAKERINRKNVEGLFPRLAEYN